MDRKTGVFVDLDKEFYRVVKKYCVNHDLYIKDFIRTAMINEMEGKRYVFTGKTTKRSK